MQLKCILDDVNLSAIKFGEIQPALVFEFLNMFDGGRVGSLICGGLLIFNYHVDGDTSLPLYVGEVNHAEVPRDEVIDLLKRLKYGYGHPRHGPDMPTIERVHYVHMEGDEVIEIVCSSVEFVQPAKP